MHDNGKPYPLDERFIVYQDGYIRGIKGKIMKPSTDNNGRKHVMIGAKGNQTVHRMVALTWVPNPANLPTVNHINGVCDDNRAENLEWCTHAYNMHHASVNGLMVCGVNHYLAKLDNIQVMVIKHCLECGISPRVISKYFKVDRRTIDPIRDRKTWKHIVNLKRLAP